MAAAAASVAVLLLAACATVKPTPPVPTVVLPETPAAPAPAPAPAAQPAPPAPADALVAPAPSPVLAPAPAAAAGTSRQVMLIDSIPAGAVIVVNGRPVGRAPVRLDVPVTPQGFFRDDLAVRARFVAQDETQVSRTATEEFTPRERVPAVLRFTPYGVQRTMAGRLPEGAEAADPAASPR